MSERKRKTNKTKHSTAQQVTTGTTIRIEAPKSQRKPKTPTAKVIIEEVNPVGGFVTFLREHAVVALALGFVIATQIQMLAKQLIASFIDPAFTLLFGQALSQRTFTLHFHHRTANFGWGIFVYSLLDVLFVLISIYAAVKIFNLEKLENPKKKHAVNDE